MATENHAPWYLNIILFHKLPSSPLFVFVLSDFVCEFVDNVQPSIPPLNEADQSRKEEHNYHNHHGIHQNLLSLDLLGNVDLDGYGLKNIAIRVVRYFRTCYRNRGAICHFQFEIDID